MSSSRGASAAFDGNIILMLNGKSGVNIESISHHTKSEKEVLYPAGSRWIVLTITEQDGKTIINLEEAI